MDAHPTILFFKHIIRKVFLEDWVLKLVALGITLALWFGVTGLSTPTTQRLSSIKLNLRYSNNIEVTHQPIEVVDLVVTGDKRRLAGIEPSSLVVSMDISDIPPGDRVINLTPETVSVAGLQTAGVRLDEIQPRRIPIRIEAVEEREVPVRAETYGAIPDGYEVYSETITPARVRVRGPAAFIRGLEAVPTERIDIGNRTTDFTLRQLPISVSDPKSSLIDTYVVDVTFRIGEKRIERVYSVPLAEGGGRRALVTLFGGRSQFERLHPDDIRIEVEKNDTGQEIARAILPDSLTGVEIRSVRLRG